MTENGTDATKSVTTPEIRITDVTLELLLQTMPEEKAKYMGRIVGALIDKSNAERKLDEIKATVSFDVGMNKTLTNDTVRKSAIAGILSENEEFKKLHETVNNLHLNIEHARIEYQKSHDLLQAYIAIATMRGIFKPEW